MSDFGKSQLLKYGWTEGKGLGRDENGILQPIKPKLKFDLKGVGHQHNDENWWQSVFNKASQNVVVEDNSSGVSLKTVDKNAAIFSKNEDLKEIQKKHSSREKEFIKTSVLENGKVTEEQKVPEIDVAITNLTINDDELFIACGGRTAHKGARHGITLSGKLARIARQEEELLLSKTEEIQQKVKIKKKRSKKKKRILEEESGDREDEDTTMKEEKTKKDVKEEKSKRKKEKKEEKKRKRNALETESEEDLHADDEISHLMNTHKLKKSELTKHQKKISRRKLNDLTELLDKAFTLNDKTEAVHIKKEKKKKDKNDGNSGSQDAKSEFIIARTAEELVKEDEDFLNVFKEITFKRYKEQEPSKFTVIKNKKKLKQEKKMDKLTEDLDKLCSFSEEKKKKKERKKISFSLDDNISTIDYNKLNSRIDKKKQKKLLKQKWKHQTIKLVKSSLDVIK